MSSTRSMTSSDKRSDQAEIDVFDLRKWGRTSTVRPGDTVQVQGVLPCGKLGRVNSGVVLNACITADGAGDQALVATTTYGRRWFGVAGGAYRLISVVARAQPAQ